MNRGFWISFFGADARVFFLAAVFLLSGCGGHSAWKKSGDGGEIIRTARTQLGRPYHFGGTSPKTGFDCSGLTGWVYAQHGVHLPREVEDQYHAGKSVDRTELREGDLVFFNISGRGPSHVGLYAGEGNFIHSPSTGGRVRTNSLSQKWWAKRFVGARRVLE